MKNPETSNNPNNNEDNHNNNPNPNPNNHSSNQLLLKNYPNMPTEQVVKNSGERAGVLESKKVKRVGAYIDRLSDKILDPEQKQDASWRERFNAKYLHILFKALVIKPENIPQSVYDQEKRLATERGYGLDLHIPANFEEQKQAEIIGDQESSLKSWYEYLTNVESGDNAYPAWFRYYAFRGMTELGRYDKETKKFFKRDETTTYILKSNATVSFIIYNLS